MHAFSFRMLSRTEARDKLSCNAILLSGGDSPISGWRQRQNWRTATLYICEGDKRFPDRKVEARENSSYLLNKCCTGLFLWASHGNKLFLRYNFRMQNRKQTTARSIVFRNISVFTSIWFIITGLKRLKLLDYYVIILL